MQKKFHTNSTKKTTRIPRHFHASFTQVSHKFKNSIFRPALPIISDSIPAVEKVVLTHYRGSQVWRTGSATLGNFQTTIRIPVLKVTSWYCYFQGKPMTSDLILCWFWELKITLSYMILVVKSCAIIKILF